MEIKLVPIGNINPMKRFSPHPRDIHGLHRLADSMRCHGMKLPLIVRKEDQEYRLIDGHQRLRVWEYLNLGEKIPCIIVEANPQPDASSILLLTNAEAPSPKEHKQVVFDLYTTMAVNLVRSKVDKNVLKSIVKYLHNEIGLGYGTIAQRIGYSKAGVQRMLKRMKAEKDCPVEDSSVPAHSLRRLKTELKRLRETVPPAMEDADDVKEAIQRIRGYIDSLIGDSAD